jgi:transcriptional regulator with XRE-family HTH domain
MSRSRPIKYHNIDRYQDIGQAIAYYRKRKGLTQEQLAERIELSRQHLAVIEAPGSVHSLSLELLFDISDALEIKPYMLLKFSPENDRVSRETDPIFIDEPPPLRYNGSNSIQKACAG